jgi:hypothetical protein
MKEKKKKNTFTIPLFLTKTCFLGAIVLAPFFGPNAFGLLDDFAVAVVSFFDLSVPCAISITIALSTTW